MTQARLELGLFKIADAYSKLQVDCTVYTRNGTLIVHLLLEPRFKIQGARVYAEAPSQVQGGCSGRIELCNPTWIRGHR